MEKENTIEPIVIIVTGPESTGKTVLCSALSEQLNALWFPELARNYVTNLERPYAYNDVVEIAKQQIEEYERALESNKGLIIFDTGLIITKVWFDVVYGKCPLFVRDYIIRQKVDLYLLCDTNIPWIADGVRENGGSQRLELFNRYKQELDDYGFKYERVSGIDSQRMDNAIKAMHKHSLL